MSTAKKGPPADERNFQDTLESLDDGKVLQQITGDMADAVRAARKTKKKAKLVLTLTMTPEGGMVRVAAECKTTIPKEPREMTLFYATDEGALTKDDPKQLTLKDVTLKGQPELKSVKGN